MATIPIEVIVQDKEVPVDPTPTPETNTTDTTEASVAVPDTGNGTMGSGINSSTSIIIIPTVILVLAIGSIIAILIHRHNKRKTDETNVYNGKTRKERRAVIITSTVAILAITVLLGQLLATAVVQPNSTNAATSDNAEDDTEDHIDVADKISIVIERTAEEDEAEAIVESTSTITSTVDFGYKVLLAMAEGADAANLYLDGDETSEYYIAPVNNEETEETETAETNIWGYALEEDGEYSAIPLADDAAIVAKEVATVEDKEIPVYYGVRVGKDLPSGTYTGELTYDLTDYITTMQEMTSDICDAVPTPNAFKADGETIEDNVPTITLTDVRDNKPYTVAKLADSKCWMTRNLDLQKEDLLAGVTLDSTNTNNPAFGFTLPDSQTSGSESWGSSVVHVYDLGGNGQEYYYCDDYSPMFGACNVYSDEKIPNIELGNYYNWYTATAATEVNANGVAVGSICPSGWRLPNADYSDLMSSYNLENVSFNVLKVFKAPMSIVRAGRYPAASVGGVVDYWSSRQSRTSQFYIYETGLYPDSYVYNMGAGYSVRCIAQ